MTKQNELKPCPMCGSSPKSFEVLDDWGTSLFSVLCCNCVSSPHVENEKTEQRAIELWNNRPYEQKLRADAVQALLDDDDIVLTSQCRRTIRDYANKIRRGVK